MDVINAQWTPDQWQQIQGYKLLEGFSGADGKLYSIGKDKKAGYTTYSMYVHFQEWRACHQCRVYFLKAQYWQKRLFSTISEDEFEQARQALLTEPNARENIESAYEKRLQERLKKKGSCP